MATNTTDVEILQVNTQPSVKSLAELKKEFKEAKAAINAMDESTEEFNKAALETSTRMNDLNEKMRLLSKSNLDFGTVVGNTSQALAGMSGLVQTVTGTLSLMGVEVGDDTKLMKMLVSSMAITQGLSAMDSGIKAVKALGIAIKGATKQQKLFNAAVLKSPYLIAGAAILATITAIVAAIKSQSNAEEEQHNKRMKQIQEQIDAETKLRIARTNADVELIKYQYEVNNLTQEEIDKRKEALENEIAYQTEQKNLLEERITNLRETNNALVEEWKNLANSEKVTQANITRMAELRQQTIALRQEADGYRQKMEDITSTLDLNNGKMNVLNKTVGKVGATSVKSLKEIKDAVDAKDIFDAVKKSDELFAELYEIRYGIANITDESIKRNIGKLQSAYMALSAHLLEEADKVAKKYGKSFDDIVYHVNKQKGTIEALPKDVAKAFLEWQKVDNIASSLTNEYEKISKAQEERLRLSKEINIEAKHEMDMSDNTVKDLEAQIRLLRVEGMIMDENNKKNKKKSVLNPNPTNTFGDIKQEEENQLLLAESKFNITQAGLDREYEAQKTYYQSLSDLYKDDQAKQLEISNTLRELDVQYEKDTLENHQELEKRKVEISQQATEQQIALINMYVDAYQTMSGAISGIIGSIADTQEQGTKEWKNLKTAEAIINTIAGGVGAFMSGVNSGLTPPFNIVLGAALAASTLAAGFAEVKKIQDTKVNRNSSSSSVRQATVQTISNTPSNVRTTNPQWQDEEYVGEQLTETSTTVTLVTSDLEALNSQNVNIKNNNSF